MNARLRLARPNEPVRTSHSDDPRALQLVQGNPILEDYLERVIAPMVGVVPYATRSSFKAEIRGHLEEAIQVLEEEGIASDEATRQTLAEYGKARKISNDFMATWFEKTAPGEVARLFGYANGIALAFFGIAQVIYVVLLQLRFFLPSQAFYSLPFVPGDVRKVWPQPLPYPEISIQFLVLLGYPFIAPLIAGWLTGLFVPVNAHRAAYRAMMPILVYSLVMGALFLPQTEALLFALFQVAFWLPMGPLTAYIASRFAKGRSHNLNLS